MAGSTISNTVAFSVTLGSANYLSPLTITSAGAILPNADAATGLYATISAGYVLDQGTIRGGTGATGSANAAGGTGGAGVTISAATMTNTGIVSGGGGGTGGGGTGVFDNTGGAGGSGGTGVYAAAGSLSNSGTILGGAGGTGGFGGPAGAGGAGGVSVHVKSGAITNTGFIAGGAGGGGGSPGGASGLGGIGVAFAGGGTLNNAGSIVGGSGASSIADAVYFGTGASRLVIEPGAAFTGHAVANASFNNVLELATGSSAGTLHGAVGQQYQGFGTINVDANASWLLPVGNTINADARLLVDGSLTNAGAIVSGVNAAATVVGSLTNTGTVSGAAGGTGGVGAVGIDLASGAIVNDAVIVGGSGGGGSSTAGGPFSPQSPGGPGGVGGAAAHLASGTLVNHATIIGGVGGDGGAGNGYPGGIGGAGGVGVLLNGGILINQGTILGGNGGTGGSGTGTIASAGTAGVGVVSLAGATLTNAGFIGGGTAGVDAIVFGTGASRLILDPGASFGGDVVANTSFSNVLELASASSAGSIVGLGTVITGFGTIDFDTGAAWFIAGNSLGVAAGQTIHGFVTGDTIELNGFVATSDTFTSAGLVLLSGGGNQTIDIQGSFTIGDFHVTNDGTNSFVTRALPCFGAGTRIRTPADEVPVEMLAVGDIVRTQSDDVRLIIWIGHRHIDCRCYPDPSAVWPVRINASAFGVGRPCRTLLLSPDHAVFVDGVLIPIKYLINGSSITQIETDEVTYYHVELAEHDIVFAEGLPVESYLDTGDRSEWVLQDFASRIWEARGCAPLVVAGPLLEAARRAL